MPEVRDVVVRARGDTAQAEQAMGRVETSLNRLGPAQDRVAASGVRLQRVNSVLRERGFQAALGVESLTMAAGRGAQGIEAMGRAIGGTLAFFSGPLGLIGVVVVAAAAIGRLVLNLGNSTKKLKEQAEAAKKAAAAMRALEEAVMGARIQFGLIPIETELEKGLKRMQQEGQTLALILQDAGVSAAALFQQALIFRERQAQLAPIQRPPPPIPEGFIRPGVPIQEPGFVPVGVRGGGARAVPTAGAGLAPFPFATGRGGLVGAGVIRPMLQVERAAAAQMQEVWGATMAGIVAATAQGGDVMLTVFSAAMSGLAQIIRTQLGGGFLGGFFGAFLPVLGALLFQPSRSNPVPVSVVEDEREFNVTNIIEIRDPVTDRVVRRIVQARNRLAARDAEPAVSIPGAAAGG